MATATITSKGQTTIPKEIRDHLHVGAGDRLEFLVEPDGKVVVIPATMDIRELRKILPPARRRVSVEQMNRTIKKRGSGIR
jgi:AbrB family looped-hinge helix DNA binding protein